MMRMLVLGLLLALWAAPLWAQEGTESAKPAAEATAKRLVEVRAEVDNLKGERDRLLEYVAELADELSEAQDRQRRLEEQVRELVTKLARAERVLKAAPGDVADTPFVGEGVVTAVAKKFCEVSIGSDDGLTVGQQLDIHRGKTYLARIVIRKANPDRSVGEVIPGGPAPAIEKGDMVRSVWKPPMPRLDDNGQSVD